MRPLFRPQAALPSEAMKTYQIIAPPSTHFRKVSCEEAECRAHRHGWSTTIDETTLLGQRQAAYIRYQAGRAFRESRDESGLTVFTFPAGQRCFQSDKHLKSLEREPLYFVRDGDYRGNPRGTRPRQHANGDDWVDDFAEHQESIAREIEKG